MFEDDFPFPKVGYVKFPGGYPKNINENSERADDFFFGWPTTCKGKNMDLFLFRTDPLSMDPGKTTKLPNMT